MLVQLDCQESMESYRLYILEGFLSLTPYWRTVFEEQARKAVCGWLPNKDLWHRALLLRTSSIRCLMYFEGIMWKQIRGE